MIAAMIDGVWLRAALSDWQEADSESARALLTAFVTVGLKEIAHRRPSGPRAGAADECNRSRAATVATIREHQPGHRRGAGRDRGGRAAARSMPPSPRLEEAQEKWAAHDRARARPRAAARRRHPARPQPASSPSSRLATPASRFRKRASSTSLRVPTVSNISPASRQPRRASIWTSGRRPLATRGASRSASSPASAPGTIRCRSPVGRRRRRWPAVTR